MNRDSIMKVKIISTCIAVLLILSACNNKKIDGVIEFATNADYPPFEYIENGKTVGFDIDLAHLIAKTLGKKAIIAHMQFSAIFPALAHDRVDAGIATITITPERKKNFDLSEPYHFESMATVFKVNNPITATKDLVGKKIACQLGSTMQLWLEKNHLIKNIIAFDNNNQAIEALKAGHIDGALMDGAQGDVFSKNNPELGSSVIETSSDGYGIAVKKGSPLLEQINQALKILQENGELKKLQEQWFGAHASWKQ